VKNEKCEEAVITTYTGRHIDLLLPCADDIAIDDIAAALSKLARFGGHTARPYTVAEHCLLGLELCTPGVRYEFLMHDATEAYLGDVTGPLKRLEGMLFYRALETVWAGAIADRFGLPRKMSKEVHTVDKRLLVTEQRDLMGRRPPSTDRYQPFSLGIGAVAPAPELVRERFLEQFRVLSSRTEGAKR
jgi:hypothetical protein